MASGRGLPSVLRTQTYERPENQDITTDILYPVSINQKQAKFVFDRKGVLDSNSQIVLRQTCNQVGAAEQECYLPTSTGILGAVSRAFLTIGGRRVSNLESVGHWNTWKRLHWSDEYKTGIANVKQGGADVFCGSASRAVEAIAPADQTKINARGFAAPYGQLGRVSDEFCKDAATGVMASALTDTTTPPGQVITSDANTSPEFTIGLSQLIPFLIGVQLPLFAMREEVALVIEWNSNVFGHRFCVPAVNVANVNAITSTISTTDVYICADYLFFPGQLELLTQEMMTGGGYDIPYDEIQTIENTEPALAAGSHAFDTQLALGGKKVKGVVLQQQQVDAAGLVYDNIGRYNSIALRLGQSMNLFIDSQPFYSKNITNQSFMMQEANQIEGIPVQLCDYRWSWTNQVDAAGANLVLGLSDRLYNGYANSVESGTAQFLGIKMENAMGQGRRISNLPMIWKRQATIAAADAGKQFQLRFFCITQRLCNISNGIVHTIE